MAALAEADEHSGGWVADGNYRGRAADLLKPDVFVWLDYPRAVVFPRVVRRTVGRVVWRRELWNGNRERWRTLVKRDPLHNILLWSWSMQDTYRERWEATARADTESTWVRLRTPREAERWLTGL
jgi:adenylate kinase family enzyme